jgi:hypothetical protein
VEVLRFVISRGMNGATADEVAEAFGCVHNHTSPRISELRRDGRRTGQRRRTRSGAGGKVLVARAILEAGRNN